MIHLIKGKEQFVVQQTTTKIVSAGKSKSPDLNVITMDAAKYHKGDLVNLTAPSILGDISLLVIEKGETLTDDLIEDVVKLTDRMSKGEKIDINAIIQHSGAVRGKKMITALEKAKSTKQVAVYDAAEIKKPGERIAFVQSQARLVQKTVANDAAQLLLDYAGDDLSVLAGYIRQLADSIEGSSITAELVKSFFKGLIQVDVYDIINAAVAGDGYKAIMLWRHAAQNGESVPSIVPRLTYKLLALAKVCGADATASSLGMAPWQVQNLKQEARRFTTEHLKQSLITLSEADYESKTTGDGGVYAFERALVVIAGKSL